MSESSRVRGVRVRGVRVRAPLDDPHLHAYRYIIPFFKKRNLSYFEQRFSLSEAIDKYKRKTKVIKIHSQSHTNVNRRLEAAKNKLKTLQYLNQP
jgi:hypothetical protein